MVKVKSQKLCDQKGRKNNVSSIMKRIYNVFRKVKGKGKVVPVLN
jgi:hypothetical protein